MDDLRRVYLGGTFDLFHYAHLELFRRASFVFDKVVVSVNGDDFVEEYKGYKPIIPLPERMAIIESIEYVDEVIYNIGGADSRPAILLADVTHIIAAGWLRGDLMKQMNLDEEFLSYNGILVIEWNRTEGISTTKIKEKIYDQMDKIKNIKLS